MCERDFCKNYKKGYTKLCSFTGICEPYYVNDTFRLIVYVCINYFY